MIIKKQGEKIVERYTTLLMDADDTIFDFGACESRALCEALQSENLPFDDEICQSFSAINAALWKEFEMNKITRSQLRVERFRELIRKCLEGYENPERLADRYIEALAKQAIFFNGAEEAVRQLAGRCYVYIITNGLKTVQRGRFLKSGLERLVDGVFISDEMGVQKPMKAFFDAVLQSISEKETDKILVVGDSLTSDMQGGRNAGLATCVYDPGKRVQMPHALCDYRIESLRELCGMVTEARNEGKQKT